MADDGKNGLININIDGDLAKPVTVFIEKVSSAVGLVYQPLHTKRMAKANADAARTDLISSIELSEFEQRAMGRLLHQQSRKQDNIESITLESAKLIKENAKTEELDEDWVAHFFDQCENVSDKQMQTIWANLLADEANQPGSVSKRTVNIVASLDKQDAELFTNFCQFCSMMGDLTPYILNSEDEVFKDKINFASLTHLDSLGLISFNPTTGYIRQGFHKYATIFYFGRPITMEFQNDEGNKIQIGQALLTQAGSELAVISGAEYNEDFYHYIIKSLFGSGLILSTPLIQK
ncbi:DUF2806 domain-containing protein [Hydrogenovibrio sp. JE_KL2]|uniref:DUF2806 domain-containing protein n=1 Tax=Hydrogenovibrio sp. JE_KL2 TaxID=2651188 RepID=UPI00128CBA75|nr:DUF2806 domain-containing protein [Hydrogenovibrio sp. JE_KL2]MPQ77151.1 DUF2806 domain-containing protein [Hydrogenovibrio sp. JE_KL2]